MLFSLPKFKLIVILLLLISFFPIQTSSITQVEQEAIWRDELASTEADIAKWQAILASTKQGTTSLQRDAAILNAKIKEAQAFIKKRNINIAQLGVDIKKKTEIINVLEKKIEKGHESLAQLIRKTNEIDQFSLPEVILGNKNMSDFFSDINTFQTIKRDLADLFIQVRDTKNLTEREKTALAKKQDQELDQKAAMAVQQAQIQKNEAEKQYLIKINKTQEKTYQQVLSEKQAVAAQIKAKLFKLAGGVAAIPFGTALTYAQVAGAQTGVSPAFVLAIITQESNLGSNVGRCYLTDTTSGAGINITTNKIWTKLMKASRDVGPFLEITGKLGFDPLKTVVSCPIPSAGGYGGAMGPAQFIPSTWQIFEGRLKTVLGYDPNPWVAQDAFMASAMYLGDLGGASGTYSGEMRAACRYYGIGGSNCSYGRSVQNLKNSIQSDIDYLNEYGISRR